MNGNKMANPRVAGELGLTNFIEKMFPNPNYSYDATEIETQHIFRKACKR